MESWGIKRKRRLSNVRTEHQKHRTSHSRDAGSGVYWRRIRRRRTSQMEKANKSRFCTIFPSFHYFPRLMNVISAPFRCADNDAGRDDNSDGLLTWSFLAVVGIPQFFGWWRGGSLARNSRRDCLSTTVPNWRLRRKTNCSPSPTRRMLCG